MNYFLLRLPVEPHKPLVFGNKQAADDIGRKLSTFYDEGSVHVEKRSVEWPRDKKQLLEWLTAGLPLHRLTDCGIVSSFECGNAHHTASYRAHAREALERDGYLRDLPQHQADVE
jgi:hypothetical protein